MLNVKEVIKRTVGGMLVKLMPARAKRVRNEAFSMTVGRRNLLDSLIRAGIAYQLEQQKQYAEISHYHQQFWAGEQGTAYHRYVREMVADIFDQHFAFLLQELKALIAERPHLTTVCEIGCGGGSLLKRLTEELTGIDRFVGVDLSSGIIAENRRLYPEIEWEVSEGLYWAQQLGPAKTIYLSFRGVLEYFTEQNIDALFAEIAGKKPGSMMVLVEPIGLHFDMETDLHSKTYGTEYTFSHNYRHLLQCNGFDLAVFKVERFDDHQICTAVAIPSRVS